MSLIRASIWLTLSELAFNISGYIIHSLMGRFLGPSGYGRYGLVITFSTMVVVLISRGVPVAMSKYLAEVKNDEGKIMGIKKTGALVQTILIGFVTVIYFLLAPLFAKLLGDPSLSGLFQLSSLVIPSFALANFYVYYFNGLQEFSIQSTAKFVRSIARVGIIPVLGYLFGVLGAVFGHILAPLSVFFYGFFKDPHKKTKKVIPFCWKKLLLFAGPITAFMLFYEIMINIDLYMVKGVLKNDEVTGWYNAALTIGRIPIYLFYFLTLILLPKISELSAQNIGEKARRLIELSMRFLFAFILPIASLLFIFTPSALLFFYGEGFEGAQFALRILSFGMSFLAIFYICCFILNGLGKNKVPMWTTIAGTGINVAFNYFLIPSLGIVGAAIATSITALATTLIIMFYFLNASLPTISAYSLFKYLLVSAIMIRIAFLLPQGKFIFIFWSILLFVFYIAILIVMKEFTKKDFRLIMNSLKAKG